MKRTSIAIILAAMVCINYADADAGTKVIERTAASQASQFTDVVKKTRDDDEGVVILFMKNAGSYYLRKDSAVFDALNKKLNESLNTKKAVNVTADSSLNILDVK